MPLTSPGLARLCDERDAIADALRERATVIAVGARIVYETPDGRTFELVVKEVA